MFEEWTIDGQPSAGSRGEGDGGDHQRRPALNGDAVISAGEHRSREPGLDCG